jgi:hypothetical protein
MKIKALLVAGAALLTSSAGLLNAQPTTSAPTPPARATAKVISIFSDAYANVAVTTFNPWWGQSTVVSNIQVGDDNIMKYANLNYQGTQLAGSVNALTMNRLHVDVWTSDGTLFQITPISPGPKEKLITCTPLVQNQWNSYDIDLSEYTGVNFAEIFQFKIVGNGTVYIDNLYFYDNTATVDTEAPVNFTAVKGAVGSDEVELLMTATDNSGAVNFEITYGTNSVTVGGVSGVQKSYSIGNLQGATTYSFSVTAKDATGNSASNSPIVITATTLAPVPPAPAPVHAASGVVSVFSDTYTSAAPDANYFPGWGQSTVATIIDLGETNKTLKYSNLNYQGMELATDVNAGNAGYLHIDVYTENETALQITPISNAPVKEFLVALSPLNQFSWNRYDIPLSTFTDVDKTRIFQFKVVGSGGKTVYIDNIYFHNNVVSSVERVQAGTVKVAPVAVTDVVSIESDEPISRIEVYSIAGQLLLSTQQGQRSALLDLSQLSKGNYLLTAYLANGQQSTHKLIRL